MKEDKKDDNVTKDLNEVKPKETKILATVADVSDLITRDERKFFMINFVDDKGGSFSIPVGKNFFKRNESRFQLDTVVSLTLEETIAGKTTWVDENGEITFHKSTGKSIKNIVKATKTQINAIGREDSVNFAFTNVMPKLASVEDESLRGAMATLMQGLFK